MWLHQPEALVQIVQRSDPPHPLLHVGRARRLLQHCLPVTGREEVAEDIDLQRHETLLPSSGPAARRTATGPRSRNITPPGPDGLCRDDIPLLPVGHSARTPAASACSTACAMLCDVVTQPKKLRMLKRLAS